MKLEQPDLPSVMTTWHTDDSLDEALWFFADAAQLPTRDESTDWLAVSVGCPAWANCIRQRLADLTSLREAVLADHDELGSLR